MWDLAGSQTENNPPLLYMHDWFRADKDTRPRHKSESFTQITKDPKVSGIAATIPGNLQPWTFNGNIRPIAFAQLVLKGASHLDYDSINWSRKDWRSRNWIQAPPHYNGSATYISEALDIADTQRWDCPYSVNFGTLNNMGEAVPLMDPIRDKSIAKLGSGEEPIENVSEVATLELPSAPLSSLAGFSGMRINPGWVNPQKIVDNSTNDNGVLLRLQRLGGTSTPTNEASAWFAEGKIHAYQSGVTGPGIGNSFMHPMLPRAKVYQDFDNSKSMDPTVRTEPDNYQKNDLKLFRDYWDHVFLLNDVLWDDYFVSTLANQKRGASGPGESLSENIDRLFMNKMLPNSRYIGYSNGRQDVVAKVELQSKDGYLNAAKYLMVDGIFNVNSTSVAAWEALFKGIRERQAVYRDSNGALRTIKTPDEKVTITRFNTEISDQEMVDPELGVSTSGVGAAWSGVRFLDYKQLRRLAEECVKQVKLRGPFLNFSEFINRRLSDDKLGNMGALQSAIDYDDGESPDRDSINYMFKSDERYRIRSDNLSGLLAKTPEAAVGSRFAGIPGYVIQSDLLKPIANTLAVRDDTFRIRAYGEALDISGKVTARAWCEAVVQRIPDYQDASNDASVPARIIDSKGQFSDNSALTPTNLRFGRKFNIESFRWLNQSEI
jgi:hypothetical protein